MTQSLLSFDACKTNIDALASYYIDNVADRNEATTRLHLIDTLLFDCLAWQKHEVICEEHQREERDEYTDYTFYAPRRVMILEAKRESDYFEVPSGNTSLKYLIKTLCRGNSGLKQAVRQVSAYCQSRGVPIAVISNGHQLVAFIAARNDGCAPLDGHAVVFPSLAHMSNHFIDLWNLLSKPGVEDKNIYVTLLGSTRTELPPKLALTLGNDYPGTKGRNVFQADLKIVTDIVIEDIGGSEDVEVEFLKYCYCRSGLLSRHSLASASLLKARYSALFSPSSPGPTAVPAMTVRGLSSELLARSLSRRPVLLIGDVGVGKTMFIRHLIRIDAVRVFDDAITLYLNLGLEATLTGDLQSYIVETIVRKLREECAVDIYSKDFVHSLYHSDLNQLRTTSIYSGLSLTDPQLFSRKELELLEDKLINKPEHLRISLEHLSKKRNKQVVIFIDNTDQRGDATQDAAFLIAQEMADRWPAMVYVPLRPETFHRSKEAGALTGYHEKAFTIEPPRIDEVIEKRLKFALRVIDSNSHLPLFDVDASLRLPQLRSVIKAFLHALSSSEQFPECIDNLAGGNVRLALTLVKNFFGSGHVDTQKIINEFNSRWGYDIPVHEFMRAVIFGDAVYYHPDRSPLANMYDVSSFDSREHFAMPIVLATLRDALQASRNSQGFCNAEELYKTVQGLGFTADQIDFALVRGHRKRLVETPARHAVEQGKPLPRAFRITTVGLYHVNRLLSMFTYVDAIIVDTPVLEAEYRKRIMDVESIEDRLERCEQFREYLNRKWTESRFPDISFNWNQISQALSSDMESIAELAKRAETRRQRRSNT